MSRHRNVRSMNYSDEYDGYDDVYGHSVEDDYTISPSDAAFMYDRNSRQPQMSLYLKDEEDIAEEDEQPAYDRSADQQNDVIQEKLAVCMEEIKNILGDSYSEQVLIKTIVEKKYDTAKVIDFLLNKTSFSKRDTTESPKPQRLTSLRSSERGGSRIIELSRNSGKLLNERVLQDFNASNLSQIMDSDQCSFERYKYFKIDFSQLLINNANLVDSVDKNVSQKISVNSNIVNKNCLQKYRHPLYSTHLSKIGYYLCIKYFEFPRILKLRKETQTSITPFNFETRSPDEIKKPCIVKKIEHKVRF